MLVHHDVEGFAFMDVIREGGTWVWDGAIGIGPCPLHYVTPEELNEVGWRMDPSAARDPDATTLEVLVQERDCVSGQAIGDRLLGPQVVMTDDTVRIAFAAEPPPGDAFDCQGTPESTVTVELPEPLGDRQIIEGLALGIDLEDYVP